MIIKKLGGEYGEGANLSDQRGSSGEANGINQLRSAPDDWMA